MKESFLNDLDYDQKRAVLDTSRHLLIVAPPGSGKTRVLASRYARLVEEAGPEKVLAVTFTNRAAREMGERVRGLSVEKALCHGIGTFHAFCLRFLKDRLPGLILIGREDQIRILRELGVKAPVKAIDKISFIKNSGIVPEGNDAEVLRLYAKKLEEERAVDLDELVLETIRVIEREKEEGSFSHILHILVDEYQDINPPQARLVRLLAGDSGTVTAIGDPDQSIYGFRGSDLGCFLGFSRDFLDATVMELKRNYRSAGGIIDASQGVISNNSVRLDRAVEAVRGEGEVVLVNSPDERAEADFLVKEIERLMGGLTSLTVGGGCHGTRFSDFVVLARTNGLVESLAEGFTRSSIPFQLVGPRSRGLDAFMVRLKDAVIGDDTFLEEFIKREAESAGTDEATLRVFLDRAAGFDGERGPKALKSLIETMMLVTPEDEFDIEVDRVSIMTMHMTKGLEFPVVFITGGEDGLIPFRPASGDFDLEEERRLFYVAMTRARDRLYITSCRRRRLWGETRNQNPSPFLGEIPDELLKIKNIEKKKVKRRPIQDGLFD